MIKNIIRKEIQLLLKEKGTYFWLFGLPILFIVLFASIFGNVASTISIHYLDNDQSAASKQLISAMENMKGFQLVTDTTLSEEQQIQKIKDGKLASLVVIPRGFEQTLQSQSQAVDIELYRDAAADTETAPIEAVLNNIASSYREHKLSAALAASKLQDTQVKQILQPPINIKDVKENSTKVDMVTQVVPGYTVMFVFFIIITMVRRFIKDKESGILSRLRSTPMKPYQYLFGMWIPNIIVVLVQCFVLLGFGKVVYGLRLGDFLSILILIIALSICVTGIGLFLAMVVRSENQGVAFTQLITMGGAALGGLWVPYDFLPKIAQTVGLFTPQYWADHSLQDIMIRGALFTDEWQTIMILLGIGVLGMVLAVTRFPKFLLTATN